MLFRRPAAGGFYKDQGCFRFVSGPGYRALWRIGEVALRVSWQLPGWCCRFWIEGLNIGNVPHVFFCVCMPSARCIMLRIVGWGVYAFSACWPVRTGVAWLCGAQKRLLAWLIPDFSGVFCIIFRVRRSFRGGGILCRCSVRRCRDPTFAYASIHTRRYYAVA